MNRLLVYPILLPVLGMLSLFAGLWQRGLVWPETMPTFASPDGADASTWSGWSTVGLSMGMFFVPFACLIDFLFNRTRDISLKTVAQNIVKQWIWLAFYAAFFAWMLLVLNWITFAPFQILMGWLGDMVSSAQNFSFLSQGLAFLWSIERATRRKPSPTPPHLWRQWQRSWSLSSP